MSNKNITVSFLTRTGLMLALALVFQIGFRAFAQPIVGPLVNMVLIMSGALVGTLSGIIVGCLTPLIAFFVGIMPKFPLIPFIMIGNALLVIVFNYIRNKVSKWEDYLGLIGAAFIKFAWLAFSVRYLVKLFMPKVPAKLIAMFSLPQLYTALIGGFLAILIMKMLPENIFNK